MSEPADQEKKAEEPTWSKKIVLSQAFILEKKKKANLVWPVSLSELQAKVRSCCWVPPSQSLITMLCSVFFVNPIFLILRYHDWSGPRTEVAPEILALSTAQHCSQCHLHRRPEPSRLEAVPPSVIWEHFLASLWCHNSGRSLCAPPHRWDLEIGSKLELLNLGFPSYYKVTLTLQTGPPPKLQPRPQFTASDPPGLIGKVAIYS